MDNVGIGVVVFTAQCNYHYPSVYSLYCAYILREFPACGYGDAREVFPTLSFPAADFGFGDAAVVYILYSFLVMFAFWGCVSCITDMRILRLSSC